jgi:hypothetical protein
MKTPLPRPLTPRQRRRLVALYRAFRQPRAASYITAGRMGGRVWTLNAANAWEAAKGILFPINFP